VLTKHKSDFENKIYQDPLIKKEGVNIPSKSSKEYFRANFLKRSFVYLITETVCEYPYPYFSEKTWKSMLAKMPFMIVGSQYSLEKLKEFGFKTFDQWWDESYDKLPTAKERISRIVRNIEKLSELSLVDLKKTKETMMPILEYNFKHLETFKSKDLENLRNNI
jgi:hypothetical protein